MRNKQIFAAAALDILRKELMKNFTADLKNAPTGIE
jgi:hypothetical protein